MATSANACMLTPGEVVAEAALAGVPIGRSVAELAQLRARGEGPRFNQLTGRIVRYMADDVQEWFESLTGAGVGGSA